MNTVSKLPSAQQEKREQLQRQEQAREDATSTGTNVNPPAPTTSNEPPASKESIKPQQPSINTPAPNSVTTNGEPPAHTPTQPTVDTVSLSREELNQLRADAEQAQTIRNRLQMLELELAEAREGLTGGSPASSGSPTGAPPAAAPAASGAGSTVLDAGDTELTAEEREEYGESEPIIAKLAKREAAALINKVIAPMEGRLAALEQQIKTTSTRMQARETQTFIGRVREKVPNFDTITHHTHWKAFLDSSPPKSPFTWGETLSKAHNEQKLDEVAAVLEAFEEKYLPNGNAGDAYAAPSVTSVQAAPAATGKPETLKMSERRKASDDYIKGRITKAELQAISDKFKEAEKEGRIDYDN